MFSLLQVVFTSNPVYMQVCKLIINKNLYILLSKVDLNLIKLILLKLCAKRDFLVFIYLFVHLFMNFFVIGNLHVVSGGTYDRFDTSHEFHNVSLLILHKDYDQKNFWINDICILKVYFHTKIYI